MSIVEDGTGCMPGDPCPHVAGGIDGPARCPGTLTEVGIWRGEVIADRDEPEYNNADVWLWWIACDLCGWDETIRAVP